MSGEFVWRDAGRTVLLRHGAVARASELLAEHGFGDFELLSTARALAGAPDLAATATTLHEVPPGQVPDTAAVLLGAATGPRLVAFGGGRTIDTAKAVASVTGAEVAAIPTTMSGAEMTGIHRLPAGAEERVKGMVRPVLVLADPEAMTSQPEPRLRFSSMNALAHGLDSLCTPLANPLSRLAALHGAESIAAALDQAPTERDVATLATGSILCGYAIDSAHLGLHHVVCQALVRFCGSPHAETNAAILPGAAAFLAARAPERMADAAASIGADLGGLAPRVRELGGDPPGLGAVGADRAGLDEALDAMLQRSELASVPGPPLTRDDLAGLIAAAW